MVKRLNEVYAKYTGFGVSFVQFYGVEMGDERQFGEVRQKYAFRNKEKKPLLVYFEPIEKVKQNSKQNGFKNFKSIASTDVAVLESFIRDRIYDEDNKLYGADLDSADRVQIDRDNQKWTELVIEQKLSNPSQE